MTMTERANRTSTRASASDVRAYLIASLAAAYVAAWACVDTPAPTRAARSDVGPMTAKRPPATVWIDELPSTARPIVQVPPGWHVADRTASSASALPTPARRSLRVSSVRPGRVRTRSS